MLTAEIERRALSADAETTPILVTIPEACRISGFSRSELYRRLAAGDLDAVKMGRSTRIVTASLPGRGKPAEGAVSQAAGAHQPAV